MLICLHMKCRPRAAISVEIGMQDSAFLCPPAVVLTQSMNDLDSCRLPTSTDVGWCAITSLSQCAVCLPCSLHESFLWHALQWVFFLCATLKGRWECDAGRLHNGKRLHRVSWADIGYCKRVCVCACERKREYVRESQANSIFFLHVFNRAAEILLHIRHNW